MTALLLQKILLHGMPIGIAVNLYVLKQITDEENLLLFDVDGPGAVTRFWVTVAEYSGKGVLRFLY